MESELGQGTVRGRRGILVHQGSKRGTAESKAGLLQEEAAGLLVKDSGAHWGVRVGELAVDRRE
jgi:hypothetical protein